MKTEPERPAGGRSQASFASPPFQAFFDTLKNPAAVCDAQLRLVVANPAFSALVGDRALQGRPLGELLKGAVDEPPPDGGAAEVAVELANGQPLTLTLSRRGETIAVLAREIPDSAIEALRAAQAYQERHEQLLLELGRQVAGATSEEELVAVVADAVKRLFPQRHFCIRIADHRTRGLTSLYAEGRLRDGDREVMVLKRSALKKIHLDAAAIDEKRVKLIDGQAPLLFENTVRGISAPLVASGQLFGMINVEYPEGLDADLVVDERLLHQLVNQVAVAIRNAKLIDELTFVRKYLEELLEHANALILVANREGRIVVFNKLLAKLTGYSRSEVLGRELLDLVPESERMRVMRVIATSLKGESVSNFETRILGPGGKEVRVSFATSSVMTAEGEVEGVIAIGQDLTVVRDLERRVIHAEKLATLGQLAASVVHEINNPMTAVATYAHAMLARLTGNPAADAGDQDKLKKILASAERILKFTRDLVSYARPAQDRAEMVDLHQLLDTAVSFCDHVLSQHGITVERSYGSLPRIPAVKGNMVQVFVNLITNACHAMTPGGKVRLVTTTEGDEVIIRVSDTGHGIKPEHLGRIFEPFFTTKPDGKGTGLGLSIVQGIVENHGGEITVESEVGRGTTFTIRLPAQAGGSSRRKNDAG
ncbi:MAG: PAS domain S-box protein [Myxococcaceae bacterium]|nr:PAS domain S-box protein [Myxococcaceae bacterium]